MIAQTKQLFRQKTIKRRESIVSVSMANAMKVADKILKRYERGRFRLTLNLRLMKNRIAREQAWLRRYDRIRKLTRNLIAKQ